MKATWCRTKIKKSKFPPQSGQKYKFIFMQMLKKFVEFVLAGFIGEKIQDDPIFVGLWKAQSRFVAQSHGNSSQNMVSKPWLAESFCSASDGVHY